MNKPRIFLGSSGKQEKLLRGLTRGLEDVAHVEPWTTSFNPGTTTLERLVELAHEVDFAAFAFAQDDWTTASLPASPPTGSGQASPRDNVVFEAGLFGGVLGMRRTFILHASGAKLPSDLSGSRAYGIPTRRQLQGRRSAARRADRRAAESLEVDHERLRPAYRAGDTTRYNFTLFPFHLAVVTAARSARASMPAITSSKTVGS
jgi:predicted nucleotide-binding protein